MNRICRFDVMWAQQKRWSSSNKSEIRWMSVRERERQRENCSVLLNWKEDKFPFSALLNWKFLFWPIILYFFDTLCMYGYGCVCACIICKYELLNTTSRNAPSIIILRSHSFHFGIRLDNQKGIRILVFFSFSVLLQNTLYIGLICSCGKVQ